MKKITDRISDTSNIPKELLMERPPFPGKAKIEITSRCDLKCFFCASANNKGRKGNIDKAFLHRILVELKDLGVEDVGIFWLGESLLIKELPEYVALAKRIGIKYVFITTNGRLATPDTMKRLMDSGLDSIKFSINAGGRRQYLEICGVDAFDQVIDNLRSARSLRGDKKEPAIYASTVFDPNNPQTFEDVKSLIGSCVDQHYPLRIYGPQTYEKNSRGKKNMAKPENEVAPRTLTSMLPCWSLFTEPHISFDGHLSACYCDNDPKLFMGNLNEMSLMEAWHSPEFVLLRRQHLNRNVKGSACENCIAYDH
ncbi:MAG: radical SAM protein [Syntrophales bacterium]